MAAWRRDDSVGHINEVTLRQARLVGHAYWDGWPFRGYTVSICNQPPRPTQPPTLSGVSNEYRPNGGEALRLRVKTDMAHSTCG